MISLRSVLEGIVYQSLLEEIVASTRGVIREQRAWRLSQDMVEDVLEALEISDEMREKAYKKVMKERKEVDMTDPQSRLGENLIGVIKAVVREEMGERERQDELQTSRVGARWSEEEEIRLIREFDLAVEVIAIFHKRNRGGVAERLEALYRSRRLCRS